MAQFYGSMQGWRGCVTRSGSKVSGLTAHVRGWNIGCRVELSHKDGKDVVTVYRTHGSNGGGADVEIAEFSRGELDND